MPSSPAGRGNAAALYAYDLITVAAIVGAQPTWRVSFTWTVKWTGRKAMRGKRYYHADCAAKSKHVAQIVAEDKDHEFPIGPRIGIGHKRSCLHCGAYIQ